MTRWFFGRRNSTRSDRSGPGAPRLLRFDALEERRLLAVVVAEVVSYGTVEYGPVAHEGPITITANNPPSFTVGPLQTVGEDSGLQTVPGWATNINPGAGDTGQVLTFNATVEPTWSSHAGGPQHTGVSGIESQPLEQVRWQTPVDLNPQYNGGNYLLIHYGSPLVTAANTLVLPVKTGGGQQFRVEARDGATGALKWTQATDYLMPPHNWVPSYSHTLTPQGRYYFAGAGGTVYYRDQVDTSGAVTPTQLAYYGLNNYSTDPNSYNSSVFINTPITSDSAGNIYFGVQVTAANPLSLQSGIVRITPSGVSTFASATTASGNPYLNKVALNAAPALSNDEQTLYVLVNSTNYSNGALLALNSTTLARTASVGLVDPLSGNAALISDNASSTPTIGPDGDVYIGVLGNPLIQNHYRGWMLHFSANLSQTKIAGAFGWDNTPSIVPASMVPSYTGSSSYLLLTKYNNYAGAGGDGVNKLAILDPNATMIDPISGATVMKEVLTKAGVTPDHEFVNSFPNAVREWCINTAAVDPATNSVFANSADGRLYRWDLTTNTFTESVTLTVGIGEAYAPTIMGADGTVYAINNATLFAVGRTNSQPFTGFFTVPPSIDPTTGTLTYQVAPGVSGTFRISVVLTDDGGTSAGGVDTSVAQSFVITVGEVNSAPIAGPDNLPGISEGGGPYVIPIAQLLSNDTPGPADEMNQTLILTAVSNPVGGTVQIVGNNVVFTPTLGFTGPGGFQYTVQDNGTSGGVNDFKSATGNVSFSITADNDPPINTVPVSATVDTNTTLIVSGISISDVDAGSANVTVTLSVAHGTLSLATNVAGGVSGAQISGNGSASIVLTAPIVAINATLANATGLSYTPTMNYAGSESLVVLTNDLGNTGAGGSRTDTDAIAIHVGGTFAVNGSTLAIAATGGDDTLTVQFTSLTAFLVTINGQQQAFNTSTINTIQFNGVGGNDSVLFYTPAGSDTATLTATTVHIAGVGYSFDGAQVEYKYIFGDANDNATFSDTAGNDQFYQLPQFSLMLDSALSYFNEVIGFGASNSAATTGVDLLFVYGTSGNDNYTATTDTSVLTSANLALQANFYDQVYAFGLGGSDTATFTASPGNDAYYGLDGYSVIVSGTFLQYLVGFAQVTANAGGGFDGAVMFDSPGNDTFTGNPASAAVVGPTLNNTANGFDNVFVIASLGGVDTANLDGSNQNDIFSGNYFDAALFSVGNYLLQVYGFENVNAQLTGAGTDLAELIDFIGNDQLSASGNTAEMIYASGNRIRVSAFDTVYAKNQFGGVNTRQQTGALSYQLFYVGTWG